MLINRNNKYQRKIRRKKRKKHFPNKDICCLTHSMKPEVGLNFLENNLFVHLHVGHISPNVFY